MKSALKTLPAAVLFILFSVSIYSQTIYFCEDVDSDGYPINEASDFTIPDDGGYLYVLVRLPYEVACRSVSFEIERNGKYDNTVYMDTEKNWVWFYKQITFYKSGSYDFYVYDCYDDLLISGDVDIEFD